MRDPKGVLKALPEVDAATIGSSLDEYMSSVRVGAADIFGKENFANADAFAQGPYWVGVVTPALHYTMGGISISPSGQALRSDGSPFAGLFVAGEATGGVHGVNRLGGNALTECVVFGRAVGNAIPIGGNEGEILPGKKDVDHDLGNGIQGEPPSSTLPSISLEELAQHQSINAGVWTAIDGKVYDMTEFLEEHPAGPESIMDVAGKDGTEVFLGVHTLPMLLDEFEPIGVLAGE